jgi:hypothetical protein
VFAIRVALQERRAVEDPARLQQRAAEDLARWLVRQWEHEASVRGLDRPQPLQVRWSVTGRPVGPPDVEVFGGQLQRHGDIGNVADFCTTLPSGHMVVLGRPGGGKSALLLLLTLALLQGRKPGDPVPVLLTLSSWDPHEHLDTWLTRRLAEEYPALLDEGRYGRQAAARLVDQRVILPVLDGLDEMPESTYRDRMEAINHTVGVGNPLLVACRTAEYERMVAVAGMPLGRAAVVELEPVSVNDAAEFLSAGHIDGRQRWTPVIDSLQTHPQSALARALTTPLMVYLARTVYNTPGRDPAQLGDHRSWSTPEQIEAHLLDAYLPAIYASRPRYESPDRMSGSPPGPYPSGQAGA